MNPWIAVTADYDWNNRTYSVAEAYLQAIHQAGGTGIIIPPIREKAVLPEWAKGLLLTGGPDVDPACFGEEVRRGNGRINPWRDDWELALIKDCLKKNRPVLGICRGIQVMAVAAGGTILQDLYEGSDSTVLQHQQQAPGWYGTHRVILEPDSQLAHWTGRQELRVNSFHHQGIKPGQGEFQIAGYASDGTVEAIEKKEQSFWVGVQWHPERMEQDPCQKEIFYRFVRACRS